MCKGKCSLKRRFRVNPVPARPSAAVKTKQQQKLEAEELAKTERMLMLLERVRELHTNHNQAGGAEKPNSIPNWRGFSHGAHVWGLTMVKVSRVHMQANMEMEGVWDAYKSTFEKVDKPKAYIIGYKAWYECARAEPDTPLGHFFEYTKSVHESNGSRADRYMKVIGVELRVEANSAYANWKRMVDIKRARVSVSVPLAPVPALTLPAHAANDAVERAEATLPSAPLAPVGRYEAMVRFLESPSDWHTFEAGTTLEASVLDALRKNQMFAVVPTQPGRKPEFELLDTVCARATSPDYEFGNFLDDFGFDKLIDTEEAYANPSDVNLWPEKFEELRLKPLSHGSFNSVWTTDAEVEARDGYTELAFPFEVVSYLNAGKAVLRAPLTRRELNYGWLTEAAAITEMVNMATAAQNGYGPLIYGIGWKRRRDESIPKYRLYAFLQRGTTDVESRVAQMNPEWPIAPLHGYFDRLLRAVWGYSSDRCVFVDAKLKNFIDTYPETFPSANLEERGAVRVIDLAEDGLRRMWTQPQGQTQTQGWRLYWLHNVLIISCILRMQLPYEMFRTLWWNKINQALVRVRIEMYQRRAYSDDDEYLNAATFVRACKWNEPLYTGRWDPTKGHYRHRTFPEPILGNDPAAVGEQCRRFATYYFYDAWHTYAFVNYASSVRHARVLASKPGIDWKKREAAEAKLKHESKRYDLFYVKKVVPMHRHFREHLKPDAHSADRLEHVMYLYCEMSESELNARYVTGNPSSQFVRKWPKMTSSSEHRTMTLAQACDAERWEQLLGFR